MKETAQFLVELATNAELKAAYEKNPEAVLEAYHISGTRSSEGYKLGLITPGEETHKLGLITPGEETHKLGLITPGEETHKLGLLAPIH